MRFKARFLRATAFPIAIYGVESWAMTSAGKKRVDAFTGITVSTQGEMWCYQRRLRVPWMERKTKKLIGVGQDWVCFYVDKEYDGEVLWPLRPTKQH